MLEGSALNLADFATAPARPALAAEGASFGMTNPSTYAPPDIEGLSGLTLDAIERLVIEHVIGVNIGSPPAAARSLGISPSTLCRKRERWSGLAA